jgi:hypothetical protein
MAKQITKTIYTFGELEVSRQAGQIRASVVELARQHLVNMAVNDEWAEYVFDLWIAALDEIGFEDAEIRYSGFCSQGDGASFTARVDLAKMSKYLSTDIEPQERVEVGEDGKEQYAAWLTHKIGGKPATDPKYARMAWVTNVAHISVVRDSRPYVHEMTCSVESDLGDDGELVTYSRTAAGKTTCESQTWESRTPRVRAVWENFVSDVEILRRDVSRAIYANLEADYEALTDDEELKRLSEDQNIYFDPLGRREQE